MEGNPVMALSKAEREQINKDIERVGEVAGAKMAAEMKSLMEPLAKMLSQHDQTLYGINRDNGMYQSVRDLVRWKWMLAGGIAVLTSATFWMLFIK